MKIKVLFAVTLLAVIFQSNSFAQNAGQQTFLSLTFPTSSHIASLGGQDLATWNKEGAYFFQNPATLDNRNTNSFFFNYTPLSGKIQNSVAGFSHSFKKMGNVGLGIQFLDYGIFERTDEYGYDLGKTFYGKDFTVTAGYSNKLTEKINYGASVKYVYSKIESYNATGLAMDMGLVFQDTTKGITIGAAIKNFGVVAKDFTETSTSKLPFDLQAGISQHLIHTPFTLFLNLHDLDQYDIRYPKTEVQQQLIVDSTNLKVKKYTVDKIFRHANFGLQIDAGKNLRLNVGYNHERRQEMAYDIRKSLAGFSFGFQLNVKKINFGYSYSVYNISGGQNNLSLSMNINEFVGVRKM
ncbi:MAG: type IX secretion system protein PorQ [Bacteroidota bacterium]